MVNGDVNAWKFLVAQYLDNKISEADLKEMLRKAGHEEDMEVLSAVLKAHWEEAKNVEDKSGIDWDEKFATMMVTAPGTPVKKNIRRIPGIAVAACITLLIAISGYWPLFKKTPAPPVTASVTKQFDIAPGTVGGVLILANGKQIKLDSAGNGLLAVQGQTKITNRQGRITYNTADKNNEQLLYNTITTPRSKQFQLVLADGSSVWLNAASSVRFPTAFTGDVRRVEITGEAYFEVAKATRNGKKIPFVVHANGMDVQVLGTHFNVSAYPDEHTIKTTLLEGSVLVSKGNAKQLLKPGEQAQLDQEGNLSLYKDIDTEGVMAWRNGYFSFDQADLPGVMRQIARWYDVDIVYEGNIANRRFGGEISRNTNVSQVLKILEESKIHFRIEDKKIVVLP
ncbi:FecR family protein [Chitinophaga niastensis]|uniref:FecR family protein n=1 Tax=Chitinophaga niastensis TaxID=536980 RepID=A0A2P8HP67_CHINA|nr:FecR domain-containing protein [Chitinophaga niastensis]PSL47998.1 FecR family protein [Chitinophaga niastensis]